MPSHKPRGGDRVSAVAKRARAEAPDAPQSRCRLTPHHQSSRTGAAMEPYARTNGRDAAPTGSRQAGRRAKRLLTQRPGTPAHIVTKPLAAPTESSAPAERPTQRPASPRGNAGTASSAAAKTSASSSRRRSDPAGPISCMPAGSPSARVPIGMLTAGQPARLANAVRSAALAGSGQSIG